MVDSLLRRVREASGHLGRVQSSPGRARHLRHRWVGPSRLPPAYQCLLLPGASSLHIRIFSRNTSSHNMSLGSTTGWSFSKVPPALTFCLIRIAHGNSSEEIAKWREERRSKFPTKAVVEEKTARQKELRERGEVCNACWLWIRPLRLRMILCLDNQ